jgi:hypothetical protein
VVSWRFAFADRDGPFAWTKLNDPDFKSVIERLREFEQMDEKSLRETGSHFIETHQFSKPARDRLQAIQLDDLDGLFSLRIQGKPRVFCRVDGGHFDVLWWDPEHEVCPSALKHT